MRRRGTALLAMGALLLAACSEAEEGPGPPTVTAHPSADAGASGSSSGPSSGRRPPEVLRVLADGLAVPWGIDFLPDGTAVVTERDTRRVLTIDASGRVTEVGVVEEAAPQGEAGLLGVAVSPSYAEDSLVYLYVSTPDDNRVVRATLAGGRLGEPEVVLAGIPNGFIHDGGRLEFGPDGFLYVSTGETGEPDIAQDRANLGGKVLRITTEGDPAPGNPDPASAYWSRGHRNVQGLAFDDRGRLWASEFGDQTFDELNQILPGRNYGWPMAEGRSEEPGLANPQVVWSTDEASPSGLAHLDGYLWMAALRGSRLWRIDVTGEVAAEPTDFFVGEYGRLRTVVVAPDGNLWVTTSNRDGRGDPAAADDRILVVRP